MFKNAILDNMISSTVLFVLGLFILIKGAQGTVKGSRAIARFFGVSNWVIGVLIVGIGTSIPELSINIASVPEGTQVGIGTIIGSNIFNILFILGLSAIYAPVIFKKEWVHKDVFLSMVVVFVVGIFAFLPIFGGTFAGITHSEGFVILIGFALWIIYLLKQTRISDEEDDSEEVTLLVAGILIVIGLVGVFVGGNWVVSGASMLAQSLGVSEAIVSILIVGVGTSLPELAVSIAALRKNAGGIAIGNIIGSNIFTFTGIIGITSLFGNITISPVVFGDFVMAFGVSFLLFISMFLGQKYTLTKQKGIIFVGVYVVYVIYLLFRIMYV